MYKQPSNFLAKAARHVVLQISTTQEEVVSAMTISRLYTWALPECLLHVCSQSPKTPGEKVALIAGADLDILFRGVDLLTDKITYT